jgi:molecular chaperone GrpE (heat shock protein)
MGREEILRRFEEWLDGALGAEDPPRGVDAELLAALAGANEGGTRPEPADAYSLQAAVTALAQEVKLQGRSFKELNETLGSQAERMSERERDLLRESERRETERRCRKEILGVLIDLRDRLGRGLESVRAAEAEMPKTAPRGWLARWFGRPRSPEGEDPAAAAPPGTSARPRSRVGDDPAGATSAGTSARPRSRVGDDPAGATSAGTSARPRSREGDDPAGATLAALKKGYELGLERLDQTLWESNAREIPCQGLPFDPRRMNAVDRQESSTVPEGTVIEVYRSGYEWNGEVFRPAQVKVACAPAGKENE